MNAHDKNIISRLESMSLDEARIAIATKEFGDIDSPNHKLCSSWLAAKEGSLRDAREEETLSISRKALSNSRLATRIAISAIVLSISMAIFEIIKWYSS